WTECQQVTGEVAAVHSGNIEGQQRLEGPSVVPIEEVSAVPFEALHGLEGLLRAPQEPANRQISKVARCQVGQYRQSHVSGRSAGGHHRNGFFLEIIDGKPVFLFRDEGFKKTPGLARRLPQEG